MKMNWIIGLSLAALAAGAAFAAESERPNHDADGNGIISRTEAQAMSAQMFARMDANKDGKLDAADQEARRAAMFDTIDSNKDGQISRAEFNMAHPHRPETGRGEGASGDHHMSGPGKEGHRMGGHRGGPMMMMRMADADKDGAVSQAEFTAAALQRFDSTDANKDGQVTKEERQASRAAMRGRMGGHKHDHKDGTGAPPAN